MADVSDLAEIIERSVRLLPRGTRTGLRRMLRPDLVQRLSERLSTLHAADGREQLPPPQFADETTLPSQQAYAVFRDAVTQWQKTRAKSGDGVVQDDSVVRAFAESLQNSSHAELLRLLGQRTTSGSITDHRAYPPEECQLYEAAAARISDGTELSQAARALDKHVARSADAFWGTSAGNDQQKNELAERTVTRVLNETTWWNVYHHFQHGLLFEIRVAGGHGARWTLAADQFIGFVEPFDQDQRRDQPVQTSAQQHSAQQTSS
ncbi:MAG: hypothetical protein KDA89_03705, partial [Planctomycetaceae bacterium]|nr:hypothetical protein [Planctomycetaceae bacterium]